MRSDGKAVSYLLFDLSKLDPAAAGAFLAELSRREISRCHWVIAAARVGELLAAEGPGSAFLRERLASGDRLFCPNPTGLDWNTLFPSEASAERRIIAELAGPDAVPFLTETPRAPRWLTGPALRASTEGLWIHGEQDACVPWAKGGAGVWWIVPGQALLAELPEGPWGDVFDPRAPVRRIVTALSPAAKKPIQAVGVLRRADSPTPLRRRVLFRSQDFPGLMDKDVVDSEETLGGIRKRQLVASMQGQTSLNEDRLQVRFQGGRLVRVEDVAAKTVLCSGSATYMEWGGKKRPFTVTSAFSFEGDFSWGLRQNLVLNGDDLLEPGRAVIDVYFVEESRDLFAAVTVRWPKWKTPQTVQSWAPLELTLFSVGTLSSKAFWPDGSSDDQLHRGERSGILSGTDFVLADKAAAALGFPQNQTTRPYLLPWKLERGSLVVNPEGGYDAEPSTEFEGLEEHFTLYLNVAEGAKLPFGPTRKQATELIPPYVEAVNER